MWHCSQRAQLSYCTSCSAVRSASSLEIHFLDTAAERQRDVMIENPSSAYLESIMYHVQHVCVFSLRVVCGGLMGEKGNRMYSYPLW